MGRAIFRDKYNAKLRKNSKYVGNIRYGVVSVIQEIRFFVLKEILSIQYSKKAEVSLLIKQDMSAVRQVVILKASGCRYLRYNRTALEAMLIHLVLPGWSSSRPIDCDV